MTKSKNTIEGEVVDSAPVQAPPAAPPPRPPKRTRTSKGALVKGEETSIIAGLSVTTGALKQALDAQTEQRQLIADFIKKHLKKGTDYIRIHVVKNCAAEEKQRGSCRSQYHFSKDVLAKPGQEKIFSLFQLSSELVRDDETRQMLEGTPQAKQGLVAYKCIVKRGEKVIAEGRGAAVVGDNRRDVNATIKIAEKRARMDACLSLGFSEYFAQDLDDPDYQTQKRMAEEQAAGQADDGTGLPPRAPKAKMDEQERTMLAKWMIKRGFTDREEQLELLRINGIEDPKTMVSRQARDMIIKLAKSSFAAPQKLDNELDDLFGDDKPKDPKPEKAGEPELVVDDELKAEVEARANDMGFNAIGKMWLMNKIAGRPMAKWDALTEPQWRRAYDIVMGCLDGSIEVSDRHIAGVINDAPGKGKS
jgi:hypothetical protein